MNKSEFLVFWLVMVLGERYAVLYCGTSYSIWVLL